jgi:hypothetical protein
MLAEFAGGIFAEDDKTSTSLGAQWANQWQLRSQFTGYAWGVRETLGVKVKGTIIRGVSILKTKYDHAEAITYRPDWMIDLWHKQVLRDLERMEQMWTEGFWDYNLDGACNEYGGCPFKQVCQLAPENREQWLNSWYVQRAWNPLTREEVTVNAT